MKILIRKVRWILVPLLCLAVAGGAGAYWFLLRDTSASKLALHADASVPAASTTDLSGEWRVVAGFGEETVFRGYLFERFDKLFGASVWAKVITVMITALWFGALHYAEQGLAGAEQATIVGLVYGTIFAITGRIWMLMVAHAAFDLVALAIIYYDAETMFAHLVFK